MSSSAACAFHSRFLRTLVEKEEMRARQAEKERLVKVNPSIDPILQQQHSTVTNGRQLSPNQYSQYSDTSTIANGDVGSSGGATPPGVGMNGHAQMHVQQVQPQQQPQPSYAFPPYGQPPTGMPTYNGNMATTQQADMTYYDTMCRELGVTEGTDIVHDEPYVHGYPPVATQPYTINH
jgi:hypothetical protein